MSTGPALGTVYYGRLGEAGDPSVCRLAAVRTDALGQKLFLFAAPGARSDARARPARAEGKDAHSERELLVVIHSAVALNGFRKSPRSGTEFAGWHDDELPCMEDVRAIVEDLTALPPNVPRAQVFDLPAADPLSPPPGLERGAQRAELFARTPSAGAPRGANEQSALAVLLQGQEAMMARLEALELRGRSAATTGAFATQAGAQMTEQDEELVRGIAQLRPHQVGAAPSRAPERAVAAPMEGEVPDRQPSHAFQPQGVHEPQMMYQPPYHSVQPQGVYEPQNAYQPQGMFQPQSRFPAHATYPVDTGYARATQGVSPQSLLMKMQGCKGRVAQQEMDREMDRNPMSVVQAFEDAIVRRAGGSTVEHSEQPHRQLLGVWRDTVPAKEHALAARTGEILCDVYRHLREGRTSHAAARVALAIGAMEQSVLDGGKWGLRAETLAALPPAPLHRYRPLGPDAPPAGKLGQTAHLVDPLRASVARAVHQDALP